MATFSVREKQRDSSLESVFRMLRLNFDADSEGFWNNLWKVLIYDELGRDILGPLVSVDELRKLGVTLHLGLHHPRHAVPEVPAVYFIEPNPKNLQKIVEDFKAKLYDKNFLNFSSPIPRPLLENFAQLCVDSGSSSSVTKVYDQFLNFVSLEDSLFTLRQKNSYFAFNNPQISDAEAEDNIESVSSALLSVMATMGTVPIIRSKPGGASAMIAQRLDQKLREQTAIGGVFNSASLASSSFQRPLLVVLDRNEDLSAVLAHSWSYQALAHDLFALDLNRLQIDIKDKDGSVTRKKFDLDEKDRFWAENAGKPFPEVAVTIKQQVSEIEAKIARKGNEQSAEDEVLLSTKDLADRINSLPELQHRKELLGNHTNIAWAMLEAINARGIDAFFKLEEDIVTRTKSTEKPSAIHALLDGDKGTLEDKLRLFLVYYVTHPNIAKEDLVVLEEKLTKLGCSLAALRHLRATKAFEQHWATTSSKSSHTSTSSTTQKFAKDWFSMVGSVVSAGMELIVAKEKDLYITRVIDALSELKDDASLGTQQFLYLDPKFPPHNTPRKNTPFKEVIVFVVGGGNYLELQNLKDYIVKAAEKQQQSGVGLASVLSKKIIYGSTELVTAEGFLRQLQELGALQKPRSKSTIASKPVPRDFPLHALTESMLVAPDPIRIERSKPQFSLLSLLLPLPPFSTANVDVKREVHPTPYDKIERPLALAGVALLAAFLFLTSPSPFLVIPFILGLFFLFKAKNYLLFHLQGHMKCYMDKHKAVFMPKRIILIRHGQSLGNLDEGIYGHIPDNQVPLTDLGHEQAKEAGVKIKHIIGNETVRFFVSPYKRSWQTYEGIVEGGQLNTSKFTVREEPRIREQDWGNFQDKEEVRRCRADRNRFGAFYYRFSRTLPMNGESGADVYDRVDSFWGSINREFEFTNVLENFVIVSHGITLRLLLMRYFKWTVEEFHKLWNLDNCQLVIMELDQDGKYRLMSELLKDP